MMYKTPKDLVAIIQPNPMRPEPTDETWNVLDEVEAYGFINRSVGSLLCVKYQGRYYVTTYYVMADRRNAEFDAAKNGFPFYATENDRGIKVGLLARLYRAIIA